MRQSPADVMQHLRLFLICIGFACPAPLPAQDHASVMGNTKNENAEFIASELQRCPCWTSVGVNEVKRRKEITDLYLKLSAYDTETLRAGIVLYLNKHPEGTDLGSIDANDKVFAFVRVIFKVPPSIFITGSGDDFDPNGNPIHEDGSFDLLWPFSMDKAGQLTLTGIGLKGGSGLPYDGLADFDHMASRFGRRPKMAK